MNKDKKNSNRGMYEGIKRIVDIICSIIGIVIKT